MVIKKKDILVKKLSRFLMWCHESITEMKALATYLKVLFYYLFSPFLLRKTFEM